MNLLILNHGSSTFKCSLYKNFNGTYQKPSWEGSDFLKIDLESVDGIGHRIVHGGGVFKKSVIIDKEVKENILNLAKLAPLHTKNELNGIELIEKVLKNKPQVAVFDTTFHQTLKKEAFIYPGPYKWYEEGIRRYGFHGISFQYCTKKASLLLGHLPSKMVICHLGSGASLCAIKDGASIDTTMGFTPLEGVMMDTRSGSIDPGILLHLLEKMSPETLSHTLIYESGLLGISGSSSEMKVLLKESSERAKLAIEIYIHKLTSHIGSMIASLQGIDTLVFTGGIGENACLIREKASNAFAFLGLSLDPLQNNLSSPEDRIISSKTSKVKVLVIHTDEAFEIASECRRLIL
jgi:acetate kinase